jgi:hypothetical protein
VQYDQMSAMTASAGGGIGDMAEGDMLTGDEIAAQVEQFLSSLQDPDDPEKQTDS